MQMIKYSSKDDPGYRAVSGVLKAFIERRLKTQEEMSTEVQVSYHQVCGDSFLKHNLKGSFRIILVKTVSNVTTVTSTAKVYFMVPFHRNGGLIGREKYIQSLETNFVSQINIAVLPS